MKKAGSNWKWVLTLYNPKAATEEVIGVFGWVGGATGYVKHLTNNEGRVWESSGEGVLSTWKSVPEPGEDDVVYEILPVHYNPRAVGKDDA